MISGDILQKRKKTNVHSFSCAWLAYPHLKLRAVDLDDDDDDDDDDDGGKIEAAFFAETCAQLATLGYL